MKELAAVFLNILAQLAHDEKDHEGQGFCAIP